MVRGRDPVIESLLFRPLDIDALVPAIAYLVGANVLNISALGLGLVALLVRNDSRGAPIAVAASLLAVAQTVHEFIG